MMNKQLVKVQDKYVMTYLMKFRYRFPEGNKESDHNLGEQVFPPRFIVDYL